MKAVVFDFDGVLADSEPLHLATYQEVFSALGITLTAEDYYANLLGLDDEGVFRAVSGRHGWELEAGRYAALIEQKSVVFDQLIASRDVLYPGAAECVERLASSFPLGIASGALRHEIQLILENAGLDRLFRFIVGAGDTPSGKPAPDPYLRAASLHGVPPAACVAIEDSRWGIASARAAGMRCVGITHTYASAELTTADIVIESLEQFTAELIERLD